VVASQDPSDLVSSKRSSVATFNGLWPPREITRASPQESSGSIERRSIASWEFGQTVRAKGHGRPSRIRLFPSQYVRDGIKRCVALFQPQANPLTLKGTQRALALTAMNRRPKTMRALGRWRTCSLAATEECQWCGRPTLEDPPGFGLVKGPKVTASPKFRTTTALQLFAKKLEGFG